MCDVIELLYDSLLLKAIKDESDLCHGEGFIKITTRIDSILLALTYKQQSNNNEIHQNHSGDADPKWFAVFYIYDSRRYITSLLLPHKSVIIYWIQVFALLFDTFCLPLVIMSSCC